MTGSLRRVESSALLLLTLLQAAIAGDIVGNSVRSTPAMNLATGTLTENQLFSFGSFAVCAAEVLAIGEGGIVELTGATDHGAQIAFDALTGPYDFHTDFTNRVSV